MLIELEALQREIPAIEGIKLSALCENLAMLGFPVDAIEARPGALVLEIDVTANRGDALSHRGLARDLAAKLDVPLAPIPAVAGGEGSPLLPISLEAQSCPLYATALLEIDCSKEGQTPDDARAFLAALGSGAKDLAPVDASNELLHRYGHPTHAFDADRLEGGVCVRWARAGESLLALGGIQLKLTPQDMVIADDSGPIALAGVIGGEATKVTKSTKSVLLESAYFAPRAVRAAAHRHGIHTDASYRFGRGADPAFPRIARDLLADRLVDWAGAKLLGSWTVEQVGLSENGRSPTSLPIPLLGSIAGHPIPAGETKAILERLGCRVEVQDADVPIHAAELATSHSPLATSHSGAIALMVIPPSWRHDLCIAEDYAEEILRLWGFDRIAAVLPPMGGAPEPMPDSYMQARAISRRLVRLGFCQAVTLGFIGPDADARYSKSDGAGRTLRNPLGQEYSVMRGSLLPSLWDVAQANLRHGAACAMLFEIAPVYESGPENSNEGPTETSTLGLVWAGIIGGEDPLTPPRPVMEADLIAIASDLGLSEGLEIIELGQNAYGMEIPMSKLGGLPGPVVPTFRPFSRYPTATRDLSLLVPFGLSYGELQGSIKEALKDAPLSDIRCVDVFKDKKLIADGLQAWLVRLRFQASDRTLTGDEVEAWVGAAIAAAKRHGAELRAGQSGQSAQSM